MNYQGQFQRFQQQFEEYTSNREILAASACGLGGIIVITLSFIGGVAKVDWLLRSGYGWSSLVIWLLIAPLGFAIWRAIPFTAHAAAALMGLDFVLQVLLSYGYHSDFPGWLIVLKAVFFGLVAQVIWEADDDEQQPPQYYQGGPPPGGQPPAQYPPGPPRQGPRGGWGQ